MAKECSWISLKSETLKYAKEKGKLWDIRWEIEWRMKNNPTGIDIRKFQGYLEEVKKYE